MIMLFPGLEFNKFIHSPPLDLEQIHLHARSPFAWQAPIRAPITHLLVSTKITGHPPGEVLKWTSPVFAFVCVHLRMAPIVGLSECVLEWNGGWSTILYRCC